MSHRVLITLGMKCPQPLFEVHKNFKDLQEGEILEVQADDPAFKLDIQAWCKMTGNELLEISKVQSKYIARIRKTVRPE
jgi:tRNA 2-thiouridine synthesizing protein A